jgi:uncharacterized membrane protein
MNLGRGLVSDASASALAVERSSSTLFEAARNVPRHWLLIANVAAAGFVLLSIAAPLLMAIGRTELALTIYAAYEFTCHQWPFRSFFLLGEQPTYSFDALVSMVGGAHVYDFVGNPHLGFKLAFCERDLGIYGAILLAGLTYALLRQRAAPASFRVYLLLCIPIAVDGFTQLLGWRESTWELRLLTGALFGSASVWFVYPRFEAFLGERGVVASQAASPGSSI